MDPESQFDRWLEVRPASSLIPIARKNAASTVIGRKMYIFGGLAAGRSQTLNVFDLDTLEWEEYKHPEQFRGSHMPCPRSGHSAVAFGKYMFIFAGEGDPHTQNSVSKKTKGNQGNRVRTISKRVDLGDLWKLDTEDMSWEEMEMKGRKVPITSNSSTSTDPIIPCSRRGHSATVVPSLSVYSSRAYTSSRSRSRGRSRGEPQRGQMWVFGGAGPDPTHGIEYTFSDLWVLDFETMLWEMKHVTGGSLPPRWGHSATFDENSRTLFIIGGEGPVGASDQHQLGQGKMSKKPLSSASDAVSGGMVGSPVITIQVDTLAMCHLDVSTQLGDPGWLMGHSAMANPHRPGYIYIFGGRQLKANTPSIETQAQEQAQAEEEARHHHHHHHRRRNSHPLPAPAHASGGYIFALNTMGRAAYEEMERLEHARMNGELYPQRMAVGPSPPCWEVRPVKSEVRVHVQGGQPPGAGAHPKKQKDKYGHTLELEPPKVVEEVMGPPAPRYCHCHEMVGTQGFLLFGGLYPPSNMKQQDAGPGQHSEQCSGSDVGEALTEQKELERKVQELERQLQAQERQKQAKREQRKVTQGHQNNKMYFFHLGRKLQKRNNLEEEMLKELRVGTVDPPIAKVPAARTSLAQSRQLARRAAGRQRGGNSNGNGMHAGKPYHRDEQGLPQAQLAFGTGTTSGGEWRSPERSTAIDIASTVAPKSCTVARQEQAERKKIVRKMLTSHSEFIESRMAKSLLQQRHAMEEQQGGQGGADAGGRRVGLDDNVQLFDDADADSISSSSSSSSFSDDDDQSLTAGYSNRVPDDIRRALRQTRAYTPHTRERAKAKARQMPSEYAQWKAQIAQPLSVKSKLDAKYRQFPRMPNPSFSEICPELFPRRGIKHGGGAGRGRVGGNGGGRTAGLGVSQSTDSFFEAGRGGGSVRSVLASARAAHGGRGFGQQPVNTEPFQPPSLPRLPLGVPVPYKKYGKMKIDRNPIDLHIDSAATLLS